MNDFYARNRLSAWLDDELSQEERHQVDLALEDSPTLRAELDAMRTARDALRDVVRAPAGFGARLDERLRDERVPPAWLRLVRRVRLDAVALAAVAAVVLVVAGTTVNRVEEEPPPLVADASTPEPAPALGAAADAPADPGPAVAIGVAAPTAPTAPNATSRALLERTEGRASEQVAPPWTGLPAGTTGLSSGARAGSWRNGVGADAPAAKAPRPPSGSVPKAPPRRSGVEVEPFRPAWETQEVVPLAVSDPGLSYRLSPATDLGLRELQSIAASLGGQLVDASGRALAPYPMESGERRRVQILIPASRAASVGARLASVGAVEVVSESTSIGLHAADAKVPVLVEITQP